MRIGIVVHATYSPMGGPELNLAVFSNLDQAKRAAKKAKGIALDIEDSHLKSGQWKTLSRSQPQSK